MRRQLALYLFALTALGSAHAQSGIGSGGVTGTIRDSYGDGLPDTTVAIHNRALGIDRTVTTSDDGVFDFPSLPPGPAYTLSTSRKGFSGWQSTLFEVMLGQTVSFQITMQSAGAAAHIAVGQGKTPVIESASALGVLLTAHTVEILPTSAHQVDPLVALSPAVSVDPFSGAPVFRSEFFPYTFFTDGNDSTNHFYYFPRPQTNIPLPQDAIGALEVISAAAPAEFGHSMGGVLNAVTKSGTQQFHGGAFGYLDNRHWNSQDRYANGFQLNDAGHNVGANLGGAVGKNLFFFFNAESDRASAQGLNRVTSPVLSASYCRATAAQCATAANLLKAQDSVAVPWSRKGLNGVARVDYRPNELHNFSFEANGFHQYAPNGANIAAIAPNGGLLGTNGTYSAETRYAKAGWTAKVADNAVNDLRFSWFHDRFSAYSNPSLLPSTGTTVLNVAGVALGVNPAYPSVLSTQRYELVEDFTVTVGTHTLKFGGDASRNRDALWEWDNRYGAYTYNTLTAFAQDLSGNTTSARNYATYTQTFGNQGTNLHTTALAAYVQDTWKVLPGFNVVMGLRWDKLKLPQPNVYNSSYYQTETIHSPSMNFGPRIGLAYALGERTVIRAGFGMYTQPFSGQLLNTLWADNGYYTSITVNPNQTSAPVFPKIFTAIKNIPSASTDVIFAGGKLRDPYNEQIHVSVERRLAGGMVLTATYLDTRAFKLWTASDISLPTASATKTYYIYDVKGKVTGTYSTLIWPYKTNYSGSHEYEVDNSGASQYHALAVQLQKRFARSLNFGVSYTWSHAFDDVSGAKVLGFLPTSTAPNDFAADRGPSAFDQRHRAVANLTWEPRFQANNPALRLLINGWNISTVATLASSMGVTPLVIVDGQQWITTSKSTSVTMAYDNTLNGSGGWSRVPFAEVNSLPLGAQYVVDARLSRSIPFTERVKATFSFDAFNALNMQYNTSVNAFAYVVNGGAIRAVDVAGTPNASWGNAYGTNARHCQAAFRITF
jgi:hypothetical protein